ncbi:hypothetical protein [Sulfurospirillum barnesii]|uniref:Uncharacterized protein n=1 Tax=Sulfurospirillum barnesii (strain ATCC 700032 / DSM 10660 / SES-3) TaxID=760154 RepID=I3XZA2_SULBS|nr:hypothetical protein [Sulfurospirillum barnesii]AFL69276.1 hypothetical protein Sulba_1997 [Sulfurospirillum barnesii SES-3]
MSQRKFIHLLKELLGINEPTQETLQTKENIKMLMEKLEKRYLFLKDSLTKEEDPLQRENLKETLKIIKEQLKKGKDFLNHG